MNSNTSLIKMSIRPALALALLCALAASSAPVAQAQKREQPSRQSSPAATTTTAETEHSAASHYSCPMHPSVKSDKAGRCPKCGMELRLTHDEEAGGATTPTTASTTANDDAAATPSRMNIPDVELVDQDGRKIHFYSDLVKGRTVAINFIFTTCTTICPPLGATFARVQRELGERTGRDVHFISISVDPATDTPERLKAWGEKFHAGAGWTLVTGAKPQVDQLLLALGAASSRREDHSPTIIIGNEARGQWTRTYGLAKPSQLVKIIDDAFAGRLETSSKDVR